MRTVLDILEEIKQKAAGIGYDSGDSGIYALAIEGIELINWAINNPPEQPSIRVGGAGTISEWEL